MEWSTAQAPGLDRPGENPEPRTEASEAKERIRQKDAPDWSIRGGVEQGTSPWTGSSGGEPWATDWNIRGNGEKTAKRRPGLEQPGRRGARPKPPDWIVQGCTRCRGLEHPGTTPPDWNGRGRGGPGMECPAQQKRRRRRRRRDTEIRTRTRARNGWGRTRRRDDTKREEKEKKVKQPNTWSPDGNNRGSNAARQDQPGAGRHRRSSSEERPRLREE